MYDIKISLYGTPTYGKSPTCLPEPKVRKQQAIPVYVVTTKTFQDVQKLAKNGVPYCMYCIHILDTTALVVCIYFIKY